MSIRTTHDVRCDVCGELAGVGGDSSENARTIAGMVYGWIRRPLQLRDGGVLAVGDICPECQEHGSDPANHPTTKERAR